MHDDIFANIARLSMIPSHPQSSKNQLQARKRAIAILWPNFTPSISRNGSWPFEALGLSLGQSPCSIYFTSREKIFCHISGFKSLSRLYYCVSRWWTVIALLQPAYIVCVSERFFVKNCLIQHVASNDSQTCIFSFYDAFFGVFILKKYSSSDNYLCRLIAKH